MWLLFFVFGWDCLLSKFAQRTKSVLTVLSVNNNFYNYRLAPTFNKATIILIEHKIERGWNFHSDLKQSYL